MTQKKPERKLFVNLSVVVCLKVIALLLILFLVMPPSKRTKVRDEFGLSSHIPTETIKIPYIHT